MDKIESIRRRIRMGIYDDDDAKLDAAIDRLLDDLNKPEPEKPDAERRSTCPNSRK